MLSRKIVVAVLLFAMATPLVAEPAILSTLLEDKLKHNIAQEGATEDERKTDSQTPVAEDSRLQDGFASYNRGRNDASQHDSNFLYGLASFTCGYFIPFLSIPLFAFVAPGEKPKYIPDDVVREEYIRGYRDERTRVNRRAGIAGSVGGTVLVVVVVTTYAFSLAMQSD